MDECYLIKLDLASKGWDIEERITKEGFGSHLGYSVYITRYDWHGKFTPSITGKPVTMHEHTDKMSQIAINRTLRRLERKAQEAFDKFKDSVPCMDENGNLVEDIMFRAFKDGRDVAKISKQQDEKSYIRRV